MAGTYSTKTVGKHPERLIIGEEEGDNRITYVIPKTADLRYGENPGQTAAMYGHDSFLCSLKEIKTGKQGPSQTNMEDAFYAAKTLRYFPCTKAVRVGKHENACGFAVALADESDTELYRRARDCDFRSFFGGVIGINFPLTREFSEEVARHFMEVLVAPDVEHGALEPFSAENSRSRSIRIFTYNPESLVAIPAFVGDTFLPVVKQLPDGVRGTIIRADLHLTKIRNKEDLLLYLKTDVQPTPEQLRDMQIALYIDIDQRSNSVVFVKDGRMVATGVGQNSRIDAFEVAVERNKRYSELASKYKDQLGHNPRELDFSLEGSSCATDAFCPFVDAPLVAYHEGVHAMVVIEGGERYEDVIREMSEKGNVSYIALPPEERHFSHH